MPLLAPTVWNMIKVFLSRMAMAQRKIKPIAHLYKTQVYQLAQYLGIPDEIQRRPPATDTYPLSQSQEEFYFSLPYDKMDMCLYGKNHGIPVNDVARVAV